MTSVLVTGLVQAAAAVVLFAGLVQGNRDLILLPALILATVNTARLMARFSARHVSVSVRVSRDRLYPGEATALSIEVANGKLLPVCARATVSLPVRLGPAGVAAAAADFVLRSRQADAAAPESDPPQRFISREAGLLWHQQVRWQERLVAQRRGAYRLGPVRVRAGDILGFFNGRQEPGMSSELIVYPRLVELGPLPVPVRDFFGLQTARTPVEDPVNSAGTRDYDASRPARHIHWKASARLGQLQEKVYEPTSQASVLLLIDAASFADPAPEALPAAAEPAAARPGGEALFERALEAAASLAVRLEAARVPVGVAVNAALAGGGTPALPPGRGPYQVGRILETLARLTRPDASGADAAGAAVAPTAAVDLPITGGTTCVVFCRERSAYESLKRLLRVAVVLVPAGGPREGGYPAGLPVVGLDELHRGGSERHG